MSNKKVLFCGNNEKFLDKELIKDCNEQNAGTAFRIPSIVNAGGTLIAVIDKASSGADWGYIEIAIRRSEDNGKTWSDIESILTPPARESKIGSEYYSSAFYLDPCLAVSKNGTVIMLVDFFPECKGIHNKKLLDNKKIPFASVNGENCLVIYDKNNNFFTVSKNGDVRDSNREMTDYKVLQKSPNGNDTVGALYKGTEYIGNIYLNGAVGKKEISTELTYGSKLKAPKRCYTFMIKSYDQGKTWTQPIDISSEIYNEKDGEFLGVAPGVALTMKSGRIIFPLYSQNNKAVSIYTDNDGKTWNRMSLNPFAENQGEWEMVESPKGKIFGFGRQNTSGSTPMSISYDNGQTWQKAGKTKLKSCKCQKCVISYNDLIVSSHPSNKRENGTLSVGKFEAKKNGDIKSINWYKDIKINDGFFAYSCLCELPNGNLGILYEDQPSSHIIFDEIRKEDIL